MSAFLLGVLVGFGGLLTLDVLLFLAMVWAAARAEDRDLQALRECPSCHGRSMHLDGKCPVRWLPLNGVES